MRNKAIVFLFILWAVTFISAQKENQDQAGSVDLKRLIRIDLLIQKRPETLSSGRNLFVPGPYSMDGSGEMDSTGSRGNSRIQDSQIGPEEGDDAEASEIDDEIRYIGYVLSEEGIVALISYFDEVMAVKIGDLLTFAVEVVRITPEEITVTLEDSSLKSFAIEGDRP